VRWYTGEANPEEDEAISDGRNQKWREIMGPKSVVMGPWGNTPFFESDFGVAGELYPLNRPFNKGIVQRAMSDYQFGMWLRNHTSARVYTIISLSPKIANV